MTRLVLTSLLAGLAGILLVLGAADLGIYLIAIWKAGSQALVTASNYLLGAVVFGGLSAALFRWTTDYAHRPIGAEA